MVDDNEFINTWQYRPIKLCGTFDNNKEVRVNRNREGIIIIKLYIDESGYQIVTPLYGSGDNNKIAILIDRCWVQYEDCKNKRHLDEFSNKNYTCISGILYKGDHKNKTM